MNHEIFRLRQMLKDAGVRAHSYLTAAQRTVITVVDEAGKPTECNFYHKPIAYFRSWPANAEAVQRADAMVAQGLVVTIYTVTIQNEHKNLVIVQEAIDGKGMKRIVGDSDAANLYLPLIDETTNMSAEECAAASAPLPPAE